MPAGHPNKIIPLKSGCFVITHASRSESSQVHHFTELNNNKLKGVKSIKSVPEATENLGVNFHVFQVLLMNAVTKES